MNPAILLAVKNVAMNLVMKKVVKTVDRKFDKIVPEASSIPNDDGDVVEFTDTIETLAVSPKKVSAWAVVAVALTGFAETQGWLPPSVSNLIQTLLSNPEVIEGIEGIVE